MKFDDAVSKMKEVGTNGVNYDIHAEDIIEQLTKWSAHMEFEVTEIDRSYVKLKLFSLPNNLPEFCREVYEFCPDTIDQGYGAIAESLEMAEETGTDIDPKLWKLAEGLDPESEDFGLKIMERDLPDKMALMLWWD